MNAREICGTAVSFLVLAVFLVAGMILFGFLGAKLAIEVIGR